MIGNPGIKWAHQVINASDCHWIEITRNVTRRLPIRGHAGLDEQRAAPAVPRDGAQAASLWYFRSMSKVVCRFCGKRGSRSKEHAWPEWLLTATGLADQLTRETHLAFVGSVVDQRVQSLQSMRDGRVCATCNNEWMSRLEVASKPIIQSLIASPQLLNAITGDDASALSLWAFKTAIVRNAVTNYRKIVPERHYHHLFLHQSLPDGVWVDAALCPSHRALSALQSQAVNGLLKPEDLPRQRKFALEAYNIVLAVGPLLLRVIHFPLPGYEIVPVPGAVNRVRRLRAHAPVGQAAALEPYENPRRFELDATFQPLP